MFHKCIAALALLGLTTTGAAAQSSVSYDAYPAVPGELLVRYVTGLDDADFINSNGERLSDARLVVQQDRANVHRFGKIGPEDNLDPYFTTLQHRQLIARADLLTWCHDTPQNVTRMVMEGYWLFEVFFFRGEDGRYKLHISPVG